MIRPGLEKITIYAVLIFLVSCAPFSKELIRESDEALTVKEVQLKPGTYLNRMVLWGGIIIETMNQKEKTWVKVLKTNLDYEKEPKNLRNPEGRFLIEFPGFLDPMKYREGRLITVVGEIKGARQLPLGQTVYDYPVVTAKQIHLWSDGSYYGRRPPPYWYDPFWWSNYPFWHNYPYGQGTFYGGFYF